MTAHAACSPSSAALWLNCPASVTQTADMTRPSSRYAREGTAAHKVAELVIGGDMFLPDRMEVEGQEFVIGPGMCRDVNPYVAHVRALASLPGAQVVIEQRIVVPGTNRMVWGTLDCGVLKPDQSLHVVDLKYGRGVAVDPDSPQLKLYALGLANHFNNHTLMADVTLTVCQPRVSGGPLRSVQTTLGDLMIWGATVVEPAIARITAGDATEKAGAHCRWCVRKTVCNAFNNRHQTHAAAAFDD